MEGNLSTCTYAYVYLYLYIYIYIYMYLHICMSTHKTIPKTSARIDSLASTCCRGILGSQSGALSPDPKPQPPKARSPPKVFGAFVLESRPFLHCNRSQASSKVLNPTAKSPQPPTPSQVLQTGRQHLQAIQPEDPTAISPVKSLKPERPTCQILNPNP